jgi:hypothetical protein
VGGIGCVGVGVGQQQLQPASLVVQVCVWKGWVGEIGCVGVVVMLRVWVRVYAHAYESRCRFS